jgi:hypothetical protein
MMTGMRCGSKIVLASLLALACSEPRPADSPAAVGADRQTGTAPLPAQDAVRCDRMISELRALRSGPQPCATNEDCTVWHNGEYWDGCPVEVNAGNGATLDRLRRDVEGAGCAVATNANCAAQAIRGCVGGECGGRSRIE